MGSILVTGASGFVGSFLVEEALRRGFEVWAGVRRTSSRRYLQQEGIRLLELDFESAEELERQLAAHRAAHGAFDYVVHCAGVTKCADKARFDVVNHRQLRLFVDLLRQLQMVPRRFVHISTLSVFGPVREADYTPICDTDHPRPDTAYGQSKLLAERYLASLPDFPYIILRPTGVYGPREADYYLVARSVSRHLDFSVGFRRQDLTFVYVQDVVQAVFLALERGRVGGAYFLSDGQVYDSTAFSNLIRRELGNPFVLRVRCPLAVLRVVSWVAERVASWLGRSSTLNTDKYKIMRQRNWQCDIAPARQELGYAPGYDLERGVRETVAWYKEAGWI